nr:hypothetical protein [Tanacetum cinerariifolium]
MKSEALKEQTIASRPIKALIVYPPNTPTMLVPRVLPTKSQLKIHIFTLIQPFLEFDKTCKKRITPTRLTDGERGFEQTKKCYLNEVIPFFKTLKEHFKGIQKALTKEIKILKDVFEELEAEVAQNVVDRKHDEIERKNLLIANDNLIANQMHNNIMATGSRDCPPMLARGRYPQWCSWFLRYVDTRPNGEALRKYILSGPYKPTTVLVQAVEVTDDSPTVPEHMTVETPMDISPENKAHFLAEKEAIHLILTGIGDDIYSTVDAFQTAQEMWKAIERNANPLALVATTQASQDQFYQTSRSQRSQAPSPKPNIPSRSHTTTRHKGKEIAKPITPPSETASEEDSDHEQAQKDKDMQKHLALIAKYFKKIYKPTKNNLITSSNSKNKNVDMTPQFKNDNQSGQFGNQRTINVVVARENVGSKVVQQYGIQCFNYKEYGHFAKECRKPKSIKDSAYHKEKMLLCKQAEQGVPLQEVPTADSGTDSEPVEQVQNEARHNVFSNHLQQSEKSESVSNTCLVETDDSNVTPDSPDMCEDDIQNEQNDVESDDESVALANLKLDVNENKKIQKQLKKANATLAQELKECKTILAKTSKSLRESISVRDGCLVALQTKHDEFEKFKAFNDRTIDYDKLEQIVDNAWIKHSKDLFRSPIAQDMEILIRTCLMPLAIKTQSDSLKFVHELKQEMHADLKYVESLEKEIDELESDKAEFSDMYDEILQDCVSKDVMCSYLQSLSDLDALAELQ